MYLKKEFKKNFLPIAGLLAVALLVGLSSAQRASWWGDSVGFVTAGEPEAAGGDRASADSGSGYHHRGRTADRAGL